MDLSATHPIHIELLLDGKLFELQVNTTAAVSILSEKWTKNILPGAQLEKTNVSLRTYTSEKISVMGKSQVHVQYGQQWKSLTCYVEKRDGPCLMGSDWLKNICLNWKEIGVAILDTTQSQMEKWSNVFKDELGTMNSIQAELNVAMPRFHWPHQ